MGKSTIASLGTSSIIISSKTRIIATLLFPMTLFSNDGWSTPIRACQKDEIIVDIVLLEPNIPVPEVFHVNAYEISECKEKTNRCTALGKLIGSVTVKTKGGQIPNQIKFDVSTLKSCPFLTRIEAQGSSMAWFGFHFANSSPFIDGQSYSVFGEDVKVVVKRARQSF